MAHAAVEPVVEGRGRRLTVVQTLLEHRVGGVKTSKLVNAERLDFFVVHRKGINARARASSISHLAEAHQDVAIEDELIARIEVSRREVELVAVDGVRHINRAVDRHRVGGKDLVIAFRIDGVRINDEQSVAINVHAGTVCSGLSTRSKHIALNRGIGGRRTGNRLAAVHIDHGIDRIPGSGFFIGIGKDEARLLESSFGFSRVRRTHRNEGVAAGFNRAARSKLAHSNDGMLFGDAVDPGRIRKDVARTLEFADREAASGILSSDVQSAGKGERLDIRDTIDRTTGRNRNGALVRGKGAFNSKGTRRDVAVLSFNSGRVTRSCLRSNRQANRERCAISDIERIHSHECIVGSCEVSDFKTAGSNRKRRTGSTRRSLNNSADLGIFAGSRQRGIRFKRHALDRGIAGGRHKLDEIAAVIKRQGGTAANRHRRSRTRKEQITKGTGLVEGAINAFNSRSLNLVIRNAGKSTGRGNVSERDRTAARQGIRNLEGTEVNQTRRCCGLNQVLCRLNASFRGRSVKAAQNELAVVDNRAGSKRCTAGRERSAAGSNRQANRICGRGEDAGLSDREGAISR